MAHRVGGTAATLTEAIRNGTEPKVSVIDGLWSVAIGEAAHRSIELRRPVELDEVLPASLGY